MLVLLKQSGAPFSYLSSPYLLNEWLVVSNINITSVIICLTLYTHLTQNCVVEVWLSKIKDEM